MKDSDEPLSDDQKAPKKRRARAPLQVKLVDRKESFFSFSVIISLTSLLLSVVAALATLLAWWQGPKIEANAPQRIYFFRDGSNSSGVLKVAVPLTIINTASAEYGDALTNAQVQISENEPGWEVEAVSRIVMLDEEGISTFECPSTSRCVKQSRFVSIEDDFAPISIGGGGVQTATLVFGVVSPRCLGDAERCSSVGLFGEEVGRQMRPMMTVRITLDFLREGQRTLTCRLENLRLPYLLEKGFLSRSCIADTRWGR